ncbi:DUF2249 domain-containing protein [Thalassotalea sp. PLHSN55]|uniref:DUF2249 domain-containing protein n=1 Tax=Thalassotalea sp. PLHSN55 TaxID=3435888 RepID=UPI003F862151
MQEIIVDVSALAPPEPMTAILKALANLSDEQFIKVIHRREPFPLYEKLNAAGWNYSCQAIEPELFHIYIYRTSQQQAFAALSLI